MFSPMDVLSVESWILLISTIALVCLYIHQRWKALKSWNIPHDRPSLLTLGNMNSSLCDGILPYDSKCKEKYGPIWGYYALTTPRIVVHDVEILRKICIKEFSNFPNRLEHGYLLEGKALASGLISAHDHHWKRSRTTIAPAFSTMKLKQMGGILLSCVDNTVKVLDRAVENEDGMIMTRNLFNRLSLDVICATAFSTDVNSQDSSKEEPEISKQARRFFDKGVLVSLPNLIVMGLPFLEPLFIWLGGMQENVVYFCNLCSHIIRRRADSDDSQYRVDLLSHMIQAKIPDFEVKKGATKGLTETEIVGNTMVMLLAGYETTGSSMSCFAYNLACHPDVQQKLQAEIDGLYDRKEENCIEAISNLKFLDMCVYESLRMYSPFSRTIRTAKKTITINGLTIPKGWTVAIPIYSLNRDAEHWDDPMAFKPERMKNRSQIDPVIFQPFGTGPRNCIGSRFAVMEIKIAFVKILRQFTFKPTAQTPKPPLEIAFRALASPKHKLKLQIIPRKN